MGLDQYAYKVDANPLNTDFSFEREDDEGVTIYSEIAYWRKHPNLQGFMEALWNHKRIEQPNNGVDEDAWFNCQPVRLTLEDLADLEKCVKNKLLPSTTGFFFGDDGDDYYKKDDLKFIKEARRAIKDGYEVYYDSWW